MSTLMTVPSNITVATQFLQVQNETYAYRRFGDGTPHPLVFLQHFTGTLDNWDPAVTDALASGRDVILVESAGIGRSTGKVPETVQGMAAHATRFPGCARTRTRGLAWVLSRWHGRARNSSRATVACTQNAAGWHRSRGWRGIMHLSEPL